MADVPAGPAVIIADDELTATIGAETMLLLIQLPPGTLLLKDIVEPEQIVFAATIAEGGVETVTVVNAKHPPVVNLYVLVAVPTATPVTTRVAELMVAIVVLLLVHAPPGTGLLSVVVKPTHTSGFPKIVVGTANTFIT